MLLRQYLKCCERKGFKAEVLEMPGEVAGLKGATIKVEGEYAYAQPARRRPASAELARECPFDSAGGRHTSFASVYVYPEVDDLDRGRHQPRRPAHRRVPRLGRRRPAREQDRVGRADHAPADQHRGAVPERPLAAPQPRRGDGHVARAPV
jgi:hypothetical protein